MTDKVELLIEETGASLQEVELALSLANYDVEGALQILHDKMKDIFVMKAKILCNNPCIYGLLLVIVNIADKRPKPAFRVRVVLSENPHVYETTLNMHWYEFEKAIYRTRLSEWSHVSMSQQLEKSWNAKILCDSYLVQQIKGVGGEGGAKALSEWLLEKLYSPEFFAEQPKYTYVDELLSLSEFKQSPFAPKQSGSMPARTEPQIAFKGLKNREHSREIFLNLRIALAYGVTNSSDANVTEAAVSELAPGDMVFAYVLENRESCVYLAELVGGYNEQGLLAVEAPVESVWREDPFIGVRVRFGFCAVGECILPPTLRVNVVKQAGLEDSWFKRILRKINAKP